MEIITKSPAQTKKIGEILAKEILKTKGGSESSAGLRPNLFAKGELAELLLPSKFFKKALVVGLEGDLGGGKTTFLQGFAKGLRIKEKILSPSFVILKRFKIEDLKFKNFYHIDCYRVTKPKEILDLGFKEVISNPQNIVAVEWADKIKKILPKNSLILKFKFINKNSRKIWLVKKRS